VPRSARPVHDAASEDSPDGLASLMMTWIGIAMKTNTNVEGLKLVADLGLTIPQLVALHVAFFEGPATQSMVVERLGLSPSAVSSLVQRLVELGLLARAEDERDRRQKNLSVTDAGRALVERMLASRFADMRASVAPLSAPVRADLARVLRRIVDELGGIQGADLTMRGAPRRAPKKKKEHA
jgi:DNA-binding MarR family transcriptional regulator